MAREFGSRRFDLEDVRGINLEACKRVKVDVANLDLRKVDEAPGSNGRRETCVVGKEELQNSLPSWSMIEVNLRSFELRRAELQQLNLKLELAGRNPSEIRGLLPLWLARQGKNERKRIEFSDDLKSWDCNAQLNVCKSLKKILKHEL